MTPFQQAILTIVRQVPKGKVVSYGQVAAYIGTPRAARQVGWAMHSLEFAPDFPWWRVINNVGKITIKGNQINTPELQKELLEAEGIVITIHDGYQLDMTVYRFRPSQQMLQSWQLDPEYVATVLSKYAFA